MERRGCVDSGCHGGERRSTPLWPASAPVTSSALWRRGARAFSIAITDGAATVRTRGAVSATASTSQRLDCRNVQTGGTVATQRRPPLAPSRLDRRESRVVAAGAQAAHRHTLTPEGGWELPGGGVGAYRLGAGAERVAWRTTGEQDGRRHGPHWQVERRIVRRRGRARDRIEGNARLRCALR